MKKNKLSFVIVTYNSERYIERCLNSIFQEVSDPEIIIVDNNSQDETRGLIQNKFSEKVQYIQNEHNIGFARAVNQGIEQATGDYLFLLNPDAALTAGSLQQMLAFEQQLPGLSLISGSLIDEKTRKPQTMLGNLPTIPNELLFTFFIQKLLPIGRYIEYTPLTRWFFRNTRKVGWVSGGALLFHRDVIEKIGLFDDAYFLYVEDIDFCKRAHDAGIPVYYMPSAKVIHKGRGSSRGNEAFVLFLESKNLLLYAKKHSLALHVLRLVISMRLWIQSMRLAMTNKKPNYFKEALRMFASETRKSSTPNN